MSSRNKQQDRFSHLKENLLYFGRTSLIIRDKQGAMRPFVLNKAQRYAHARIEAQKARIGKVRVLLLKGRQQGMSTYASARFFHQTVFNPGATTFILSHQAKTTGPLFDIVKRYHANMPEELAPVLDTSNKNQMKFAGLNSEYTVGTAGNEDIGRGFTIKHLHGSEVGFYEKTDYLETGLFQAVADMAGTEIILESTANGMNNMFYRMCMDALAKKGEYELIFIPWYWQEEYCTPVPPGFALEQDEMELQETYELDNEQLCWRRNKIVSLGALWKFQQEYPMNVMEAFIVSGDPFYGKKAVFEARKCQITDQSKPMIGGLDCARVNDRSAFTIRQGRQVLHFEAHTDLVADGLEPTQQLIQHSIRLIKRFQLKKLFIDMASGYGVVDGLKTLGYGDIVVGVYFQQGALDPIRCLNKRAEIHLLARDWFDEGPVNIPDDDDFFKDLMIIPKEKKSPSGRWVMPPKAEIRSKYGVSPDIHDSFILTFAFPVNDDTMKKSRIVKAEDRSGITKRKSECMTLNRIHGRNQRSGSVSVSVNNL